VAGRGAHGRRAGPVGLRGDRAHRRVHPLDRLYAARFPNPSDDDVQAALRSFLDNAEAAADLDAQIAFTDGLIDQIVYRLYDLTEEGIGLVQGKSR